MQIFVYVATAGISYASSGPLDPTSISESEDAGDIFKVFDVASQMIKDDLKKDDFQATSQMSQAEIDFILMFLSTFGSHFTTELTADKSVTKSQNLDNSDVTKTSATTTTKEEDGGQNTLKIVVGALAAIKLIILKIAAMAYFVSQNRGWWV